mmetsp:Transcript_7962/g.21096  ORF Transcript_7962/g.21096 Transcript_7962/m.21096 type:complete len:231 (-) Transcript_7962:47-739(-)
MHFCAVLARIALAPLLIAAHLHSAVHCLCPDRRACGNVERLWQRRAIAAAPSRLRQGQVDLQSARPLRRSFGNRRIAPLVSSLPFPSHFKTPRMLINDWVPFEATKQGRQFFGFAQNTTFSSENSPQLNESTCSNARTFCLKVCGPLHVSARVCPADLRSEVRVRRYQAQLIGRAHHAPMSPAATPPKPQPVQSALQSLIAPRLRRLLASAVASQRGSVVCTATRARSPA